MKNKKKYIDSFTTKKYMQIKTKNKVEKIQQGIVNIFAPREINSKIL